jgi:cobalt-zinc-cadmium efflux system outer membrane protein
MLFVAQLSSAEPPQRLTLQMAIGEALTNNPGLLSARERVEAAMGRALQMRLWPNPELELSSEEFPPGDGFSASKNLVGMAQTVPFPGKRTLDSGIGAKEVTASEWEYLSSEIALVRDVKTAFYRTLAAEKKLSVSEELVTLAQSLADATRKRVAAGEAAGQEQLRAEIELERTIVELTAARRELVEARNALGTLMGRPRETLGPVEGELPDRVDASLSDQALEKILARNPDLRAGLANRERAELELRRAKLDRWPDITVGVAGGRDEGADETLMALRVSLPLPLFDRAQGRGREARAIAEIARYDLTATEQRLVQEFGVIEARLKAAGKQVESYRTQILPKAEEALRLVRGGFEAGKFGFLDLVDTQRTSAEVRLAYYDKLLDLSSARAELDALLLKDLRFSVPDEKETTRSEKGE